MALGSPTARAAGDSRRIAVLSQELKAQRYGQWLAAAGCEAVLFTSDDGSTRECLETAGLEFADVRLFTDYQRNRVVDQAVVAAHMRRPFDRIVALSECDTVRAARLREHLGVPGQDAASALTFRDTALMKALAARIGLAVPAHRRVEQAGDLLDFAAEHGWEISVKPCDWAGAAWVEPLLGRPAVESWIERCGIGSDDGASLWAEEKIDAPVLAIDGLTRRGTIQAAVVTAYSVAGVLTLAGDNPQSAAAIEYVGKLLAAVPGAAETMGFHGELFAIADRGLLLCELGGRTGGADIEEIARRALDIDLRRCACLGQAGLEVEVRWDG